MEAVKLMFPRMRTGCGPVESIAVKVVQALEAAQQRKDEKQARIRAAKEQGLISGDEFDDEESIDDNMCKSVVVDDDISHDSADEDGDDYLMDVP